LTWHYYPLFRLDIDQRWTLYIDADKEGEVRIGMVFIAGDLFEAMTTGKLTPPPKMLHAINDMLREVST
jgi:hypothetical protein